MSGGWWKEGGEWVRGTDELLDMARRHTFMQQNLGWARKQGVIPGSVKFPPKDGHTSTLPWSRSSAAGATPVFGLSVPGVEDLKALEYIPCPSFIAQLGDSVRPGAFVLAQKVRSHAE